MKPEPQRTRLPAIRPALVHKVEIDGKEMYVTVGFYDDDPHRACPAEVFVIMSNMQATAINALVQGWAVHVSMQLQYGVPWRKIYEKFADSDVLNRGLVSAVQSCVDEREAIVGHPAEPLADPPMAPAPPPGG